MILMMCHRPGELDVVFNVSCAEASQNLFAVMPFPPESGDLAIVAGTTPTWDDIERASDLFQDPAHNLDDVARAGRIKFPGMSHVYASTLDEIERDVFPGTLQVLVGHPLVYGWHIATFHALTTSQSLWIVRLWQAALTVTMHVVVNQSAELLAAKSMVAMDKLMTTAAAIDESWPSFARKAFLAMRATRNTSLKVLISF